MYYDERRERTFVARNATRNRCVMAIISLTVFPAMKAFYGEKDKV